MENAEIPTSISRDLTYSTTDAYYYDLLGCQDNRMRYFPKTILTQGDGEMQLSAFVLARAVLPHFSDRSLRYGPFVMTLTDLHQSNIFVDSEWRITNITDLEWAAILPIEMQRIPTWLTGRAIDGIIDEELEMYESIRTEFMSILAREEQTFGGKHSILSHALNKSWQTGSFWYFHSLTTLNGLWILFMQHLQKRFDPDLECGPEFERLASAYWCPNASEFVEQKVAEKEAYQEQLHEFFAANITECQEETDSSDHDVEGTEPFDTVGDKVHGNARLTNGLDEEEKKEHWVSEKR